MSLEFIKPQLATTVDHPPPRAGWIHEVKYDGYRTLLIIERRGIRAYTRNGFDWTERYASITMPGAKLECRSAIIDGEVIVQDERGISDFEALKSAIRWQPQRLILCAFDLLHLNGMDLRNAPLLERRARLRELVPSEHPFLFSEEFTGDAAAFFRACVDHQLEGMVSKLVSSKYRSGRSKTWLKTKCFTESSFLIIGTARDRKTKAPLALLARLEAEELTYAGSAFITLSRTDRAELSARLQTCKVERWPIPKLRELMLERQREGVAKAKAEGKYKGRAPTARAKAAEVRRLHSERVGPTEIAKRLRISRASVYRVLAAS